MSLLQLAAIAAVAAAVLSASMAVSWSVQERTANGWLSLLGPVCRYWVFVVISGIRPLEHYMSRTRGEMFRRYQQITSRFLPMPSSAG